MKSYKEVNEELILPDELKKKTIEKMTAVRKHGLIFKYAFVASFLLIGVVSSSYFAMHENNNIANISDTKFYLKDYVTKGNGNEIGGVSSDIAGEIVPMNELLQKQIQYIAPDENKLVYPKGYETKYKYGQYIYEDTGPYPVVYYYGEKDDIYKIYFSITDEKMPYCVSRVSRNDESLQSYKNYRLSIKHVEDEKGNDLYWFFAYRDNYYLEATAYVEQPEDFENFLRSVLLP